MSAFTDRITDDDIRWLRAQILSDPTDFPRDFTGWIPNWVGLAGLDVPISQITGFSQFTAQTAEVATGESTTSTTYTDLATVGPSISGLPAGSYVILFGAQMNADAGTVSAVMSVDVNGAGATDADDITTSATVSTSHARALTKTLSASNNTLVAKYKSNTAAHTVTFQKRWMIALRYANA